MLYLQEAEDERKESRRQNKERKLKERHDAEVRLLTKDDIPKQEAGPSEYDDSDVEVAGAPELNDALKTGDGLLAFELCVENEIHANLHGVHGGFFLPLDTRRNG